MYARYLGIDFTSLPTVRLVSGQSLNHAKSLLMGDSQFSALKVTEVRLVQPKKARQPILETVLPMATEVRPVQPIKVRSPIEVTELGMVTEDRLTQPSKALSQIHTVPSLMATAVQLGISPLNLYATLPIYTIPSGLLSYHGVFANAAPPIKETESGIVTEVRPEQPQKAQLPIDVTESGMGTKVKPVQPSKALLPIEVAETGMVTEVKLL